MDPSDADIQLYCCAIKDVFSNRIVGYSISDRMTAKLAVDAVRNAVSRRGEVAGCILHADRGSQFRSRAMARELRRHDMVGSMGRVGAAGDNAAMESFFATLKSELFYLKQFTSVEELRKEVADYIHYYNNDRITLKLKGLSPVQYRTQPLAA